MKTLVIKSKKYGVFNVILDDDIYLRLQNEFKNMKWCVRVSPNRRNLYYFQKRLSNGKLIELHRWILGFPEKGKYIDHINHNTLDNRKENLRIVTNSDNLKNSRLRIDNKSGCKGVRFDTSRNKWAVVIKVNYKKIYLGRFSNFDDAVKARKEAEIKYW
jgi:hypothetical protein